MAKILLVEDDELVAEAVIDFLKLSNHTLEWTKHGEEGLQRLALYDYELAIVDWKLPGLSGIDLCQQYRAKGGTMPILILSGKGSVAEKLTGFDAGADDYLAKPFSLQELTARVRALLRRPHESVADVLKIGSLSLDLKACKLHKGGREITLLPKEFALLEFFMRHREQIFGVNDLLNKLWSSESDSTEDAVRQCIARLRKKIDAPDSNSYIVTVKGLGYKLQDIDA